MSKQGQRPARPQGKSARGADRAVKTREMRFMESPAVNRRLDTDSQRIIQGNRASYYDADFYVRKAIAGTGDLLDASNVKAIGLSSFNENKLPELTTFVMSAIRVSYATHASLTNPAAVKYDNSSASIPVALLNAELVIKINDKPVVELPVSKFFNANGSAPVSFQAQGPNDTIELKAMKLITPKDILGIELKLPAGLTLGANNHFLEVRLLGIAIKRSAN